MSEKQEEIIQAIRRLAETLQALDEHLTAIEKRTFGSQQLNGQTLHPERMTGAGELIEQALRNPRRERPE